MRPTIRFYTDYYYFVHSRRPKGRGFWHFRCNGRGFSAWGTYTECKRQVAQWAMLEFPNQSYLTIAVES